MTKTNKILIIALLSVAVIAMIVMILVLALHKDEVLTPDYAPEQLEQNAEKIEGESGEKLDVAEGGGAVALNYTTDVTIDLSDKSAAITFANPGKSHNNIVLRLVVQGTVVAQSGRIEPGYRVSKLDLLEGAAEKLAPGAYETDTRFEVLFYDPESDERAFTSVDIPLVVIVQE